MKPGKDWARADALRVFREKASSHLLDYNSLLRKFSIEPEILNDPEAIIPIELLYRVFDAAAAEMGNDAILFDMFHDMDLGEISVFDYLFVCAPTIRDGCKAWERFNSIRSSGISLVLHEPGDDGVLEWTYQDMHGPWQQNMFARMAWATRRFELALGCDIAPVTIEMAAPVPAMTSEFQRLYKDRLLFNCRRNAILIPAECMDTSPHCMDNNLYAIIQKAALDEQEAINRDGSPVIRVADEIAETLKTGNCTLDQVSSNLGMSSRSVQRLLEEEGTSFRKVTEDIRKAAATRYLRDTSLPMKEIAYLLGFSEISTFSRAVKGWFGHSPKDFRRQTVTSR
ncbi:MAG: AraC family transcriptional regulator ligand-binding domain-containing protein [Oceanospirillaceae bacterium]|nr:AraC family transcriptional regulator ligand-binding domain-containing protein [Oceanospirillaceae bacterium]